MLKVSSLNLFIEKKLFLKNVNFHVKAGQVVRLVAPNGGGKTTLIESILGLNGSVQGTVELDFSSEDYGYLPQVAHQFPKVYLKLKDICETEYSFYSKDLFFKSWHTSSGGERKKALIAKAMSEAKKLIILDEPFNHLDPMSCKKVEETILEKVKAGLSVIYTGHEYKITGVQDIEVAQWKC